MARDNGETPHDEYGSTSDTTPKPADIATELPDTTDEDGMPLENPSGG